ncbi:MAG: ribosome small subunit-dependent GTPase A [Clostridia bacterium]|nr:ribosome small subunit-dependent GTPase A [Clostridia bacterium]
MPEGRVVRAVGGFYDLKSAEIEIRARARGKFRGQETIYVGDWVEYSLTPDGGGVIEKILPRKNLLKRPYVANVDRILLVFSFKDPVCPRLLIDKFLLLAEDSGLEIIVVFNKADLASADEQEEIAGPYRDLGYKVIYTSALTQQGKEVLLGTVARNVTVLAGPSGVGKSSLLNMINPAFRLKTGDVSQKIKRGRHTTRQVELLPITEEGFIVDTPGFSRLDLDFIDGACGLTRLFPDFTSMAASCRFTGCRHLKEPGCAVREAVEKKAVNSWRYEHYLIFLEEVENFQAQRYR